MVVHKAERDYANIVLADGAGQDAQILQPVVVTEKDLLGMVTPVNDVVRKVRNYYSGSSSHTTH